MRIVDAITNILESHGKPMGHIQIHNEIKTRNLFSFGAKDPISVVRSQIRKHCFGLDFPSASPKKLFTIVDNKSSTGKPLYYLLDKKENIKNEKVEATNPCSELLTEEIIHNNYLIHLTNLKQQLLGIIKSEDPALFEKLVVDLLLKMGYGWNETTSGKVVGGSGDEGIDGIISEDKLGLENIYIQAKRYSTIKVPPIEVRDFIGTMTIQGARKGVFFTTSDFTKQARKHAKDAQGMSITLVDGDLLSDLLVQHEMGIAKVQNYTVYEVDKNFFTDE
jgi:restriction system protein